MDGEPRRTGIPPSDLSDEDLERELEHLHSTRRETFLSGSPEALKHHTERMLELEAAYAERFPDKVTPGPYRMRGSSRRAAGQDVD
jgi:Family of unknown function (DUF6158)